MKGIRIRPEHDGLRASLFDLEAEIMELIWLEDWHEFAVADVHQPLADKRKIAYTTVMTTVARLHEKGLLARRKLGRKYLYRARMTRTEFIQQMTREVLDSLPPEGHEAAVALLVERVAQADESQLDRLEDLIRDRRRRARGDD